MTLSLRLTTPDSRLTWVGFLVLMVEAGVRPADPTDFEKAHQLALDNALDEGDGWRLNEYAKEFTHHDSPGCMFLAENWMDIERKKKREELY